MTEALIGLGLMMVIALLRIPIAIAMGVVGFLGVAYLRDWNFAPAFARRPARSSSRADKQRRGSRPRPWRWRSGCATAQSPSSDRGRSGLPSCGGRFVRIELDFAARGTRENHLSQMPD